MLTENLLFAENFLNEALSDYEGNGTRYEPADRQELIDLINQVDSLRERLTVYMANLPFLDHHPIDTEVTRKSGPVYISDLFDALDKDKYISPDGPLIHSVAYQQLKELFGNTRFSLQQVLYLLRRERSN